MNRPRAHTFCLRSRASVRGFVLPVTVILLALISVGVALMSHRSDQLRTLVVASRQEQQASVAAQNALAEVVYLSNTLYRRSGKLGNIALDGRFYRAADGTAVSLQDTTGLFNLKRARTGETAALLVALGVPAARAQALEDTLQDYIDADSLTRASGAEAPEYQALGLPPPRNGDLLTATELQRIAGWRDLDAATMRQLLELVYLGPYNVVNRFTVRPAVLAAVGGVGLDVAREMLAQRPESVPLAIESLPSIVRGGMFSAGRFVTLPSVTTLVTICPATVAWCQQTALTLTGDAGPAPWHVGYSRRQMRSAPLPTTAQMAALPDQPPAEGPAPLFSPFGNLQ